MVRGVRVSTGPYGGLPPVRSFGFKAMARHRRQGDGRTLRPTANAHTGASERGWRGQRHSVFLILILLAALTAAGLAAGVWLWPVGWDPLPAPDLAAGLGEISLGGGPVSAEARSLARVSPELAEVAALKREVLDAARRLVNDFPTDPAALAVTAQLQYRLGNSARALECWQECLRFDPGFLDAHFKMALITAERGDYHQATAHYRDLLAAAPGTLHALTGLAEVLVNLGETQEAIALLQQARQIDAASPGVLMVLGQALLQTEQYTLAKQSYEQVLHLAPGNTRAYHGMATACARLGLADQARQYREQYEKLRVAEKTAYPDPGGVQRDLQSMRQCAALVHQAAADVYTAHGRSREAADHWRKAARADAGDVASREALVAICRQEQKTEEALKLLAELCQLQPENPRYVLLRGSLLAQQDRFDEAERAFLEACRLAPQRGAGYAALAQLYWRDDRRLEEAVTLARKAVELEPAGRSYAILSEVLARSGDAGGARRASEQAISLEPDNAEYRRHAQTLSARP